MGRRYANPLVLLLVLCLAMTAGTLRPSALGADTPMVVEAPGTTSYLYGTLLTDPSAAPREHEAGVRLAHLELGWDSYEPQEGIYDPGYAARARDTLASYQAAGMLVVVGVGLQYPPSWVFTYPDSRYVNQFGATASRVNLTFNQALRDRADAYIARVMADLGPENVWAVRVGSGGLIETLYPGDAKGQKNSYWAYDTAAQGGSGRPPSIGPSPMPGWHPGQRTFAGQPVSQEQIQAWYDWYLGALVDGVNWQIAAYRRAGFDGYVHLLMPGQGTRPSEYAAALQARLDGSGDPHRTMPRGAVWDKVIEGISDRTNVVAYVSSLADGSGDGRQCQPGDAKVERTDRQVLGWSATRWISAVADSYDMAKMGENPGRGDTKEYGSKLMRSAADEMSACGFMGMMWAHSRDLEDPDSGLTLADYAAVIQDHG